MIHQIHEIDLRLSMQQQKIYFSLQLVNDLHRTRKKSTFYSTQNTRIDNDDILRSSCKNTFYMNGIEKSESEKRKKNRCCLLLLFLASFCCKQNRKNVKCEWEKSSLSLFDVFFSSITLCYFQSFWPCCCGKNYTFFCQIWILITLLLHFFRIFFSIQHLFNISIRTSDLHH